MAHDPYVVDALGFALNHPPCIICCSTLRAMDMVHQYLLASLKTVGYLRESMSNETKKKLIGAFDTGTFDYLVTSTQFMYQAGFYISREGACIASSTHVTETMFNQIAGRIYRVNSPAPDSNRLFLWGTK